MWISRSVCLFIIYSFMGWIYETIFCTIKKGKWENRGFLYGPVCPIYGIGVIAISTMLYFISRTEILLNPWHLYLICVVGSALLEYVTSWALEKLFHALWWDYSSLPLNLHGRISLFTSLGFGFAGLLVIYVIMPFTEGIMGALSPIATECFSLLLLFLFTVDFTLTVTALLHFDRIVIRMENRFNRNMEIFVDDAMQQSNRIKQEIAERKTIMKDQVSSLSGFANRTIFRVYSFKDRNKQRETVRNNLLSAIKRIKQNHPENTDED